MTTSSHPDYSSKVLLFGEYSVLVGSSALAHPLTKFSGRSMSLKKPLSAFDLKGLYSYLEAYFSAVEKPFLDLKKFSEALKNNWCFDSNIPVGKGLGSSGALCAAIFNEFGTAGNLDESELRKSLGEIESYFHMSSSGIDPLISLLQKTYLINKSRELTEVTGIRDKYTALEDKGVSVYLVDSGISRQASPFVKLFKKKLESEDFKKYLVDEYLPINEEVTSSFLNTDVESFKSALNELSEVQLKVFREMFLKDIYDHAKIIHSQKLGRIKLCGAGGGGFSLLFSYIGDDIKKYLPNYDILKLKDYL